MDLSKLSSDLPLPRPLDEDSLDQVNRELSNEFKIGARSIAALYRLASTKTTLINATGYLKCLNDVISLIDNENVSDLSELKTYLQLKRSELTGKKDEKKAVEEKLAQHRTDSEKKSEIITSPPASEFTASAHAPFHFPPSRLPIGVHPQVKHRGHHHHNHTREAAENSQNQKADKIREFNAAFKQKQRRRHNKVSTTATAAAAADFTDASNTCNSSDNDSEVVVEDDESSDDEPMFATDNQSSKRKLIQQDCAAKKTKL
ncbi:DEKNAAC100245 [Brettanomyces naardenensis]|uniref:DEKNAAC100245 n=1 Tax=Brettanomyces naardenensis TaxID=13370 RepID=A0A448YEK4_BRENA|nr:DEKNAAC100245 [Brettanomyces naardenensis]